MVRGLVWLLATAVLVLVAVGVFYFQGLFEPPEAPLVLARAAYAKGQWREASDQAMRHLRKRPYDREALRIMARTSARLGQGGGAQAIYSRLGSKGFEAEDCYAFALTLLADNNDEQAQSMLEQALALDPNHPEALLALAELCLRREEYLAGAPLAERLAHISGWQARGAWALGRLRMQLSEPKDAAAAFSEVLRHDPECRTLDVPPGTVCKQLARAYLQGGQPRLAREALEPLITPSGPVNREAAWLLSRCAIQEGDWSKASAALAQAGDFRANEPLSFEPSPYVGSAACVSCHAEIHRDQQTSLHAQTMTRGAGLCKQSWPDYSLPDPRDPNVSYTFNVQGDEVRVRAEVDKRTSEALVLYALGSGSRATSFVVRDDQGAMREFRLSRFAKEPSWDLTLHHPEHPATPAGYLGKSMPKDSVRNCLSCHSTDFRAVFEDTGPEAADHGIGCERCHGPGGNHAKAAEGKFNDWAIVPAKGTSAQQRSTLCAQCHQGPPGADVDAPEFVRFQTPNLARSRCYVESEGKFGCVTCHNPHKNAEKTAAYYEAVCLKCHAGEGASKEERAGRGNVCPVNAKDGCVRCHMPTVESAVPRLPFTDHYIRVHR